MAIELKGARRARVNRTAAGGTSGGTPTRSREGRAAEARESNEGNRSETNRSFWGRLWRALSFEARAERDGFYDWREKLGFEAEVTNRRENARREGGMW